MEASARKLSRRTQEERREEAEHRLLEAAVRIIGKTGVETFTLADVGEAAGYSRGLPAHYFKTKSGLLAAVVRYLVDHYFRRATFQGRQRIATDDIVAEVSSFIEVAKKNPLAAKAFMAAMAGTFTNPSLADVAQKHNAYVIAKYEEGILDGIKHGEIDSGIAPTLGRSCWWLRRAASLRSGLFIRKRSTWICCETTWRKPSGIALRLGSTSFIHKSLLPIPSYRDNLTHLFACQQAHTCLPTRKFRTLSQWASGYPRLAFAR